MPNTPFRTILITGASGGIGGALAAAYANSMTRLILHGRDLERLSRVGKICKDKGADVHLGRFDLADCSLLQQWLKEMDEKYSIDLIIANAGVNTNTGVHNEGETWSNIKILLDVNIIAVLAMVNTILPSMRARRSGQIAIISSLAGWRGLPETPSYSASKAAVKAYGEAMRDAVAKDGVKISVVMPGYVHSKMAYDMPGPKPFIWTPERAARAIYRGLAKNKARISFPFPLNFGCWLLAGIHPTLSGWILRRLNFGA